MQSFPSWLYAHLSRFDNNFLHHAYLISGRKGVGKSLIANRLAMQVLCHSKDDILCGECHSCKLSDLENHPDFHTLKILPEKKWFKKFEKIWAPSEKNALKELKNFIIYRVENYSSERNIPSIITSIKIK